MKKVIINGKILKIYDSIDELPILNFQKYNKYILIDSGIGSDIDDIDKHILKLSKLIKTDINNAAIELQNMRLNMFMIVNGISPKYLAFTSLIYSIDGEKITDLSDENLKNVLSRLNQVKHSWIINFLVNFKKKVDLELESYFPNSSISGKEKEAYDKLKLRALLALESIIEQKNNTDEIEAIDSYMLSLHKPKLFNGSSSIEIKYDKQFENSCLLISQKANLDAKKMNVLEFYNAIENIKKQIENEQKCFKHNK